MAGTASPLDLPLHPNLGIMAQRRRGLLRQADEATIKTRRLPIGRRPASRHQSLRRRTQRQTEALHLDRRSRQNYPRRQTRAPSVKFYPLARHRLADLFLDTLPYNAHTTSSDALWAGLPVLTRIGETFADRVAASLLNAIGLPELITTTLEAYEQMAIDLATHPEKLAAIKHKLCAKCRLARTQRGRPVCS